MRCVGRQSVFLYCGLTIVLLVAGFACFRQAWREDPQLVSQPAPMSRQPARKLRICTVHGAHDLARLEAPAWVPAHVQGVEAVQREQLFIVQFGSPVTPEMRAGIEAAGGDVRGYLPEYAYLVEAEEEQAERLEQAPGVRTVARRPAWFSLSPNLVRMLRRAPATKPFHVVVSGYGRRAPEHRVAGLQTRVHGVRLVVSGLPHQLEAALPQLLADSEVAWVEPHYPLRCMGFPHPLRGSGILPMNDDAAWNIQSGTSGGGTPMWDAGLTGAGQIVGVTDSGLDADHGMFWDGSQGLIAPGTPNSSQRKVIAYYDVNPYEPGDYDYDPVEGVYHGTHVAGSVAGKFVGSTYHQGMAPGAKLIINDAGDYDPLFYGDFEVRILFMSYAGIFDNIRNNGGWISSNSWGGGPPDFSDDYNSGARAIDAYAHDHPNFLILFAANNAGTQTGGSISYQANAKNALVIGATGDGSLDGSGDIHRASFSSNGPTGDGRIRPHVMAPGYFVNSALGDGVSTADTGDDNTGLQYMAGTSMATPNAAGAVALVREYFTAGYYPSGTATPGDALTPTAALLKAMVINSGEDLFGNDNVSAAIPDNTQGWGRIILKDVLYLAGGTRRVFAVNQSDAMSTGQEKEFNLRVDSNSEPLRVTLVWTDPEAVAGADPALVNNLNLTVVAPNGSTYLGNVFTGGASQADSGSADALNTEECVYVPSPATGTYTIRVTAENVPVGPQSFALVVTGPLVEREIEITGNGTEIADGDTTPGVVDDTDYGTISVGGSLERQFTILNTGITTLSLTGGLPVSISGDAGFTVSQQPSTSTLLPGQKTTMRVTFSPAVSGVQTATVSVASTDSNENPYTFALQGSGGSSDLVAWWKMDETTGTVAYDSSGNGNHATLHDGAAWAAGRIDGSLDFDGVNDCATVLDHPSLDISEEITLAAWVRREGSTSDVWAKIIAKAKSTSTSHYPYYLGARRDGEHKASFMLGDAGGGHYYVEAPEIIPLNSWTHIAGTYDGTTMRLYINGTEVATLTQSFTIYTNDKQAYIAGVPDGSAKFNGKVDDARIYRRALDPEEIGDLAGDYPEVYTAGSTSTEYARDVEVDSQGNKYLVGSYRGSTDFNTIDGDDVKGVVTTPDLFVTRINADGSYGWTSTFTGSGDEEAASSVALDGAGNLYVCGHFRGTMDFDPGTGVVNRSSSGKRDMYLAKLSCDTGALVWLRTWHGGNHISAHSVCVDANGDVLLTGYFEVGQTVDFDPGTGTANRTANGIMDVHVTKLTAAGDFVWVQTMGGTGNDRGHAVDTDSSNNVFIAGYFERHMDFDPGSGTDWHETPSSTNAHNIFVTKLTSTGSYGWTRSFGSNNIETGDAIVVDGNDDVILAGRFKSTVNFDQAGGTDNHVSAGDYDVFVTKYQNNGDYGWTRTIGGTATDTSYGIAVDATDNVYVTGCFQGTAEFAVLSPSDARTSAGGSDAFFTKFASNGDYVSTVVLGSTGSDGGRGIASGGKYGGGYFSDTVDFGQWGTPINRVSNGSEDIFMTKLKHGEQAPIAVAGVDTATPQVGLPVTLSAASSYHPATGRSIVSYDWFQIDGPSVIIDLGDPVHPTFTPPTPAAYRFRLVVTDDQGVSSNDATSAPGNVATVDLAPPVVVSVSPTAGSTVAVKPNSIVIGFSKEVDAGTVDTSSVLLVRSGGDGTFGDGNEVSITPASVTRTAAETATMDLTAVALPPDAYQLTVKGDGGDAVADLAARKLDGEFSGSLPSGNGVAGGNFVMSFRLFPSLFVDVTATQVTGPTPGGGLGVTFLDLNGDKHLDIGYTSASFNGNRIFLNNGSGSFAAAPSNAGIPTNSEGHSILPADYDDDGDLDIAVGWYWAGGSKLFRNGGTGALTDVSSSSGVGNPGSIHGGGWGDVDKDGDLDLAFARNGANMLFINNGSGSFSDEAAARGAAIGGYSGNILLSDLDGDGDLDMIENGDKKVLRNDGSGYFSDMTSAAGIDIGNVALGDIDNDGDLDAYSSDRGIYLNDGSGAFTDISSSTGITMDGAGTAQWFDVNNDGFLDLVGNTRLWLSNGDLTFTEATSSSGLDASGGLSLGDIDGDGDLDLFNREKKLYANQCDNSNYLIVWVLSTNSMPAVGAKVWVYREGHVGESEHLLGFREITGGTVNQCYNAQYAHFGLPYDSAVDIRIQYLEDGQTDTLLAESRGQTIWHVKNAREINIRGNGNSIADGDTTPTTSDHTDFGLAVIGRTTVSREYTIENLGPQPLTLTGDPKVSIGGTHPGDFAVTAQPASPIAGAGNTTFTVEFDPQAVGIRRATVSIANDDADENPYTFELEGEGYINTPPVAVASATPNPAAISQSVSLSGVGSFDPDDAPVTPITYQWTQIDNGFPSVTITDDDTAAASFSASQAGQYLFELRVFDGADSDTAQVEVLVGDLLIVELPESVSENAGVVTGTVRTSRVVTGSPLSVALVSSDTNVATVESLVSIPVGQMSTTFDLTVLDDDVQDGDKLITIQASALDWVTNQTQITIVDHEVPKLTVHWNLIAIVHGDASPDTADGTDFGEVESSGTASVSHVFTLGNDGTVEMNFSPLSSVDILGAHAADFRVSVPPSGRIDPGGSRTMTITFDPIESGVRTATVRINTDDPDSPFEFVIQGTGKSSGIYIGGGGGGGGCSMAAYRPSTTGNRLPSTLAWYLPLLLAGLAMMVMRRRC